MAIVLFLLLLGSGSSMDTGSAVYSGGAGGGGGSDDEDDENWGNWKGQCLLKNSSRTNTRKTETTKNTGKPPSHKGLFLPDFKGRG